MTEFKMQTVVFDILFVYTVVDGGIKPAIPKYFYLMMSVKGNRIA